MKDKEIIGQLMTNCRLSYREMSKKIGLGPSSIKKRVDRLLKDGFIESFELFPNPALLNLRLATFMVYTDSSIPIDIFTDKVFKHEIVYRIHPIITGDFYIAIEYISREQLETLAKTIEKVNGVVRIERYELQYSSEQQLEFPEFSNHELKVLEQLLDDVRMQPHEIADRTGLTVKRVTMILNQFDKDQRVRYLPIWNPNRGRGLTFTCKISYNPNLIIKDEFLNWMYGKYLMEYWGSRDYPSYNTMFSFLTTNEISEMEEISQEILSYPGIQSCSTMLHFRATNRKTLGSILLDRHVRG